MEVIASDNCLAADLYAVRHLGLKSEDDKVIQYARQLPGRGLAGKRFVRGPLGRASARMLEFKKLFPIADASVGTHKHHTSLPVRDEHADTALARLEIVLRS
jgi:hypothetical protein